MVLDTAIKTGGKEFVQRVFQKGSRYAATTNWDKALKNLNPETIKAIPKEITDQQLVQIKNLADVKPEAAIELMGDFQRGVQDKEWGNFGAGLANLDKASKGDEFRALQESPLPEKEFVQPEELPKRYDVEGPEGKKEVRTAATPWWQEQMKAIEWDPKRAEEIDRSAFAPEGIFIDGEQYRFQGVTKYARDRKTVPTLTKVKQSVSKISRHENELAQTFGPKVRAKPKLVDALGDVVPAGDVHQHHVLLLSVLEPWTRKADGSLRDRKQLKQLFTALSKRDWWTGNVDKNLVWQNVNTHFQDAMSSHKQLIGSTDIQGRPVGEKFVEGFGPTEIPGKTYTPDAMHGFSNEFIRDLSKETDTKKLIKSLLMFLEEGGGGEAMEGAAYSAQKNLEPKPVIEKTGKIKEVKSGDILAQRRGENPRVKKNVERFEAGRDSLKKDKE